MNRKRTYRLYADLDLQVRTRKRRKLPRRDRIAPQVPERAMQRWSLDFIGDQLVDSRRFRVLNIVDDHSRFCPGQIMDVSISGARMACFLDDLALRYGLPEEIMLDNGPKGASRAMFDWSERTGSASASWRRAIRSETRLRRELEREALRRMPEPALVPLIGPRSRGVRPLAPPLQRRTPSFGARLLLSIGVPTDDYRDSARDTCGLGAAAQHLTPAGKFQ